MDNITYDMLTKERYSAEYNWLYTEKSPYLLQHKDNPVNWLPWHEQAFQKAKEQNKPIFLSIGYSTCHWCHVMAHESFEDEEVAKILNDHYISIKVDREERPDVDTIYMSICQAMTGQGGWPLTIIMTPDKEPFFAGTYFPKTSRYGRAGIMDILSQIHEKWEEDHEMVINAGKEVVEAVLKAQKSRKSHGEPEPDLLETAYKLFADEFDSIYGGFGRAPKFPTPHNLLFLLRHGVLHGEKNAINMVKTTLDAMYHGGIFDHIGFGFARYSTDRQWLVPHFEKMLYDNALLAYVYLEAYQATKEEKYKEIAQHIFEYILRTMTSEEGGFYSAEDADSEGVEGKFYVWRPEEIIRVLGEEDGNHFCRLFDIWEEGNFEDGTSIPNLIKQKSLEGEEARFAERCRQKLFAAREQRVHPHKDDKILTAWNGLMIAAMGKGAMVLQDISLKEGALKALSFIRKKLITPEGRLMARYREGEAAFPGYLDDYAFLIWGCIELYQATFHEDVLSFAVWLQDEQNHLFWDGADGGYFFYGVDGEDLISRPKELYDGAMPSGNSISALNLIRLYRLTGREDFRRFSEKQLASFAGEVSRYPRAYSAYLLALQWSVGPAVEIFFSSTSKEENGGEMVKELYNHYFPCSISAFVTEEGIQQYGGQFPFWQDKKAVHGLSTAYVCQDLTCHKPVQCAADLREMFIKLSSPMV